MGRVSKKFFSSSVIKKKSVTSETFLIEDKTLDGGSDTPPPVLVYDNVTSMSFLNFIRVPLRNRVFDQYHLYYCVFGHTCKYNHPLFSLWFDHQ